MNNLLLICLAYHNHEEVRDFVIHIQSLKVERPICVIVVENTPGRLPEDSCWLFDGGGIDRSHVRVVGCSKNLGYFGGMNYGYQEAKLSFGNDFNWVVVSNTDIRVKSEMIDSILGEIWQEGVAVVAPRITSMLTGRNQNPMYISKPSKKKFKYLSFIFKSQFATVIHRGLSALKAKLMRRKERASEGERVYAAQGSFLCISRKFFECGGHLNYPHFLFCEEIFLAEQVKKIGMNIVYTKKIDILHDEHQSVGLIPSKTISKYLAESHRHCLNNYF